MSQPAVDVIINNYNYARYLPDAIDSALQQTYPRVRVIVVDDGSTDDSASVIESYGGAIQPVLKRNGGQASAFNAGLERSSGDIVMFLDADDLLVQDIAERVVAAFGDDPSIVKVHFPMEVIDRDGRPTGIRAPQPHLRLPEGDLRRHELAFPFDLVWMATSGNAFAAEAVRRIAPVPEDDFRILADWYLNHLIALLGEIRALADVGSYRRMHDANIHALTEGSLDLDYLRRTIVCASRVRARLVLLARAEGLAAPRRDILSVSDAANRLISLRLGPMSHPVPRDTVPAVCLTGARATLRRFDVRWPMKTLFLLWFAAFTVAPRRFLTPLAERFLLPERRVALNTLLARLQRTSQG
jgi:glycosyltransferase involved in cell wall biosynthesis